MTWQPGSERIRQLLDDGQLEQVTPDVEVARRMLLDAGRHLATATTAESTGDLAGAYQLAYDALRKSAVSLLAVSRPTANESRRAHRGARGCHRSVRLRNPGPPLIWKDPPRQK
jgi:hypothetical protein